MELCQSQSMSSQTKWRQTSQLKSDSEMGKLDLTLRLGFPNSDKPVANLDSHHTHQVKMNNLGLAFGGGKDVRDLDYNPNQILWSKELKTYVLKSKRHFGELDQSSFNYYGQVDIGGNANSFDLDVLQKKDGFYTLLNPTSRRVVDHGHELASSDVRGRGLWRRLERVSSSSDKDKRCTNYNCNTKITPMWRSGPLGPKSLCNACGIRYRKEMLNRESAVAAEEATQLTQLHHHKK